MSKWQPIETAPKDGRRVILFTYPYGAGSGHFDGERWVSHFCINGDASPNLWMPIPEPPPQYYGLVQTGQGQSAPCDCQPHQTTGPQGELVWRCVGPKPGCRREDQS